REQFRTPKRGKYSARFGANNTFDLDRVHIIFCHKLLRRCRGPGEFCAYVRLELAVLVVKPSVLRGVSDNSLNVSACFAERYRFYEFVHLRRERSAPLRNTAGPGIVCNGHEFDAAETVELVAHIARAEFDIERRLVKRFGRRDRRRRTVFSCDLARG